MPARRAYLHVGLGDLSAEESPFDPTEPNGPAEGANFRLETRLGPLDVMQSVPGIDTEPAYRALADAALTVRFRDTQVAVRSRKHLIAMKRTAGRPQDLEDLTRLG